MLEQVLNTSRQQGSLPPTFLEGITTVLYKKKDPTDTRNYRPITLLNNDYKIMTRVLTARLNHAIKQIVDPHQNGFVPDGFIAENTMLLNMLKALVEDEDSDAIFVFLDMEKAFDRCSWEYMQQALQNLGLGDDCPPILDDTADAAVGDNFAQWVNLFYSNANPPTRRIRVGKKLGRAYELHSGVAQGCSLSPLLFIIIAEALTRLIQNDNNIEGIAGHKISQYADDSTLIARLKDRMRHLVHVATWEKATSMKENDDKREGILLGKLSRERHRAPKGIVKDDKWVEDGDEIITLGAPLGNSRNATEWWWKKYKQIKARISKYYRMGRHSISGRNLIIQSILYGSMRYWLFSDIIPEEVMDAFEEDAYHMMWSQQPIFREGETGSKHRRSRAYIKRPAAYLPQKRGGAGGERR